MNKVYSSRNGFHKYHYEIRDEGLLIKSSSLSAQQEFKFPYDIIPSQSSSYTDRSRAGFWCMIVFMVISLIVLVATLLGQDAERYAVLFWGSISVACVAWYLLSIKHYIIYEGPNGTRIPIYFSRRQRQAVQKFVALIEEAKHQYIEKKIEQYIQALGRDRVNALIIEMRENMILDTNGYDRIMKKADELNSINIVGFRKERN